ncbi:hypothetical protein ACIA49_23745 [Kribbella sp. NPDC051587]|uniref:hypothetical protein n=1 Tax=Kribbella sp. NPDC051587 TaxID=3364119 RepID=UPI0037BBB3B8
MRTKRVLAGTGIATALLLSVALPASAQTIDDVPGVKGVFDIGEKHITVYDTLCDDDSVYAQWKTIPGEVQRIRNNNGCGSSDGGYVPMGDGEIVYWRVCVDRSLPTRDKCSSWLAAYL